MSAAGSTQNSIFDTLAGNLDVPGGFNATPEMVPGRPQIPRVEITPGGERGSYRLPEIAASDVLAGRQAHAETVMGNLNLQKPTSEIPEVQPAAPIAQPAPTPQPLPSQPMMPGNNAPSVAA